MFGFFYLKFTRKFFKDYSQLFNNSLSAGEYNKLVRKRYRISLSVHVLPSSIIPLKQKGRAGLCRPFLPFFAGRINPLLSG
ncbi:hypothetical protein ADH66_00600 [Acutalibacter muris]|uniref:Uncharacterized protein n=1 Tax=Acutalibacter muris TaxID=1796620 RepID=A0ABM6L1R9_9FIRM|nr:hypothetical protein A4V00_08330 [Hungateiclostridiaceae bacterium KB18]ASB39285.1 hypothetical protein ADH66_00600 [Acutalibacter muris]